MARSRREVLISGGVVGAGLIAADFPITKAFAAAPPLRQSLKGMAWNHPILETYRDAVAQMKAKPAADPFNWTKLAHIHGTNPNQFHFCPHGNWYLLPWHRAYVVTYEKIVRQLTGNKNFAMPYWDWTTNPKLPDQFTSATLPNNQPNALFEASRTWPANTPMPANIVGPSVLQSIMQATPFEVFGTTRPMGQNSLAQSWIVDGSGSQGILEGTPHNNVHNNIGGWMPSAMSPMDPIFFMHHSNIDRIWDAWNHAGNANSPDPLWTDMTFQNNFINPDGTPWSPQVKSLYVPEDLGYTYHLRLVAFPGKNLVLIENKLIQLIKWLKNPGGPVEAFTVFGVERANIQAMGDKTHLALAVKTSKDLIGQVRARKNPLRAAESDNFRAAAEARAPGTHAYVLLTNVDASDPGDAEFRVFVNADNPTPATPLDDPHYVGTFAILSHGMRHGEGHMTPSFLIDATDAVARVGGDSDTLTLQIVPVPNKRGSKAGTVGVERVQVAFLAP